jgi:hypothetical protein
MSAEFINRYETNAGYVAEASERLALGSTVSLVDETDKVHFDGKNVEAIIPRQGDVLYVPSTCAYTPESDGSVPSGTPEGTAKIIALETLDDSAMQAAGYESVGVVGAVFGKKVYIVWKNVDTTCKWAEDATSSSYSIPSTYDVSAILQDTMDDNASRQGWRQGVSFEVLRSYLSGEGLPSGQSAWNGGYHSDGDGSYFYTKNEWITTDQGNKHPSADELTTYGTGVDGWERYLRSRFVKYPSFFNAPIYKDGKAETKILTDINASEERAFFPIANFATTHYTTYGSFGTGKNFWNVPGLRYGDWFMAGAKVQRELFKDVSCSNSSVLKSTDRVNIAMSKISSTRISLYEKWYWLPVLLSRGTAWYMNNSGNFYTNYLLSSSLRVLSCALLNY